ncbi:MAG: amidohydrolase [Bacteroidota bacterium]
MSNENSNSGTDVTIPPQWLQQLIDFRRELHTYPELSGREVKTVNRILELLSETKPDSVLHPIGGNSLAFVYQGENPGPCTWLRCELDALPIPEDLQISYQSVHEGVSHKCGHDGHMSMLAGVAFWLNVHQVTNGKIVLLFQSAEETGEGARAVVQDPLFALHQPDYAFALHNLPAYPLGRLLIKSGTFNCASKGIIIRLTGHTSHAAHPEQGNSPLDAMCQIMKYVQELPDLAVPDQEVAFATVVHARLGEIAFGTSPAEAVVMATLRAEKNETVDMIYNSVRGFVNTICLTLNLSVSWEEQDHFDASLNHPEAMKVLLGAGNKYNGLMEVIHSPFRWSEDFGAISQRCRGAMFGIGAGEEVLPLHHPAYDFPDELIVFGMEAMIRMLCELHQFEQ